MKKKYFISYLVAIVLLILVYYGSYYYTVNVLLKEQNGGVQNVEEDVTEEYAAPIQVVQADTSETPRVEAGTAYILETYQVNQYTLKEEEFPVPVEYMGLDREKLVECLSNYEETPSEDDLLAGFVSIQLVSFSQDKIVIRKSFDSKEAKERFYLMVEDYYVVVYCEDMRTVYTYTGIPLSSLPADIQNEIMDVKFVSSLHELYNFLETYSS